MTQSSDGDRYAVTIAESAVPAAWEAHTPQCRSADAEQPASTALLATRAAELREREHDLEARLSAAIHKLPNVRSATVLLTLARSDRRLDDLLHPAPSSPPRVLVSLVCSAKAVCPNADQLLPLLSAAVPGIAASHVRVLTQLDSEAEPDCAELAHIGPLTVTRASLPMLKIWLAASLVLHMLGSVALVMLVQRKRRRD